MSSYKVALIGASGNIGSRVLAQLLASKSPVFEITVLKRLESKFTHDDPKVSVHAVDFAKPEQLVPILKNKDYVVPLAAGTFVDVDALLEASIAAGVPRIFSCELSLDCLHPTARAIAENPIMGNRIVQAERLEKEGQAGKIEWTTLVTGSFIDWSLNAGFVELDIHNHKAILYNGGEQEVTGCSLNFVADAFVYAINHWDEVKNKRVQVSETKFTTGETLRLLEKHSGKKYEVEHKTSEHLPALALEALQKGDLLTAYKSTLLYVAFHDRGACYLVDGLNFGKGTLHRRTLDEIVASVVSAL